MTDDATTPEQPRTAAGRALLTWITTLAAIYPHPPLNNAEVAAWAADILAIEAQARPAVASDGLRAALEEALDGWESADEIVDHDRRVSSDPPCEDEARIAAIRAALASDAGSVGALDVEPETEAIRRCVTHHACDCHTRLAEIGRRYLAAAYDAERQGDG